MMGTKVRNFSPLPRDVSLEELVPSDHFYRFLERTLDLSFVREFVAPLYAGGGRPSVDPVVFFKLQLVMFFKDLRSERQLMKVVADRLSLRWYLGYDLREPLPDHSSLTRIRERYGLEVFRGFFDRIVQMCFEAGLVWGEELFVDSTAVRANAAKAALVPRFAMREHLDEQFEEGAAEDREKARPDDALPNAGDQGLRTANSAREDFVSSAGRHGTRSRTPNPNKISDQVVNRTDPDACLIGQFRGTARMGAVNRNFDEAYFEKVKGYYGLEAYRKAMRKRKVWIEPIFAEAKQWHGMERVRLRTLERVNAEVLVTAAGQNVKRLLALGPRTPGGVAQAAALRPPERPRPLRVHHHPMAHVRVFQQAASK